MGYRDVPLEKLLGTLIDYRGKTPPKTESGVPLITAKVIKGGRIAEGREEFIAEEFYDEWMRRGLPQQWDVLITTEAPLGEVAILKTTERVALAQRVILLRGDPKIVDQRYLCFALQSPIIQARLAARSSGTTVAGIKQSELRQVAVPVFDLPTQRHIASILSAYDDLIENNTHRIAILEEMARRLFEEWFVRFHFPGHEQVRMVDSESELGSIPEGWETTRLGELFDFIGGAQPPKVEHRYEALPGYIRFVQNRDYGSSQHLTYIKESRKNKICGRLDIMVDKYGEAGKTRFGIAGAYNVALANIFPKQPHYREWLRGFISRPEFCEYLASASQAATRASLNSVHFGVPVVIPPDRLLHAFANQVTPMLKLTLNYRDAVSNLRAQRDLLLPKLISGEIDVSSFPEPEAVAA